MKKIFNSNLINDIMGILLLAVSTYIILKILIFVIDFSTKN